MEKFQKSVIPLIESVYSNLTPVEREIANFFMKNEDEDIDFSAQNIGKLLHVSEPSLTRFAKKCGFLGFRQFIYEYQISKLTKSNISQEITQRVLFDYEELLNKTYSLVDEERLERVTELLIDAKRVYIYGKGSSGLVAQEMKLRFMRLGLICEAISDNHMILMNEALLNEECLVIGVTVSGQTEFILQSIRRAYSLGAKTVMLTSNNDPKIIENCNEIILVAVKETLSHGNKISPQFPLLVMVDIFYAYFLNSDRINKETIFSSTLSALEERNE